jgi:hypothetical protein
MVKKLAGQIIETMRDQPALLASLLTNIVLLVGFAYILMQIAGASERKDARLSEIASHCMK